MEVCLDKEGNTGIRDVYFICPCCKGRYDTYEQAKECLVECAEEEWGIIDEIVVDEEPEYEND